MPAQTLFVQRPPNLRLFRSTKVAPNLMDIPEFNLDEQKPLGKSTLTHVAPIRPPRKKSTKKGISRFKLTLEIVVEQIVEDEVAEENAAEEQKAAEQEAAEQKAPEQKAAEQKVAEQKVAEQNADELKDIFQSVFHDDVGISIHSSLYTATEFLKKHERDKYNYYAIIFNRWLKSPAFFEKNANCFINDLAYMGEETECSVSCFQFFSKEKKKDKSLTAQFVKELLTMNFQLDLDTANKLKDRVKHMVQGDENTVTPQDR